MTADNRWYSVLDDFDAHLQQQVDALETGHAELIVAFEMPPGIGSLPPNLEPRLEVLRRRSAELERVVATRRDEIARRLALLPRPRATARPFPSYLDTSA